MILFSLLTTSLYAAADNVNSISGPATIKHGQTVTLNVDYEASQERVLVVYLKTTTGAKTLYYHERFPVEAGSETKQITFTVPDDAPTNETYKYGTYIAPVGKYWKDNLGSAYQQNVHVESDAVVDDNVNSISGPATIKHGESVTLNVDYEASQKRHLVAYLKRTTGEKKNRTYYYKRVIVQAGSATKQFTFTVPDDAPTDEIYKYGVYIAPVGGYWKNHLGTAYQYDVHVESGDSVPVPPINTWHNISIPTQNTATVATFTATPTANNLDTVIGFSDTEASAYSDLGIIVRFASNGKIDVRNGGGYASDISITYQANTEYTFRVDIDFTQHTYDVYVKPSNSDEVLPNSDEVLLANDYDFRADKSTMSEINYMAHYSKDSATVVGEVSFVPEDPTAPENPLGTKIFAIDFSKYANEGRYTKVMFESDFQTYEGEDLFWIDKGNGVKKPYVLQGSAGIQHTSDNGSTLRIVKDENVSVLQVKYRKGIYGGGNIHDENSTAGFLSMSELPRINRPVEDFDNPQEVTLKYSLKFKDGFDFKLGGKLPGLSGGYPVSGGVTNGDDDLSKGFSARFVWIKPYKYSTNIGIKPYLYFNNMPTNNSKNYGVGPLILSEGVADTLSDPGYMNDTMLKPKTEHWYKIKQTIKANTPLNSNGTMKVWIDGVLKIDLNELKLIADGKHGEYAVDMFMFSTFFGGHTLDYAPKNDSFIYFKDIEVFVKSPQE